MNTRLIVEALAEMAPGRVFILSALYGLMRPWQRIQPYDLRLGAEGSVTASQVRIQAQQEGVLSAPVVALCGADYAWCTFAAVSRIAAAAPGGQWQDLQQRPGPPQG